MYTGRVTIFCQEQTSSRLYISHTVVKPLAPRTVFVTLYRMLSFTGILGMSKYWKHCRHKTRESIHIFKLLRTLNKKNRYNKSSYQTTVDITHGLFGKFATNTVTQTKP